MNIEELVTDSGWVTADGTYGVGSSSSNTK